MSPAIQAVVSFLGGWRATIFAFWFVCALIGMSVVSEQRNDARANLAGEQIKSAKLTESNRSNLQVIADLQAANQAWADVARDQESRAAQAIQQARAERDAAAAELSQRRQARGNIYATNPDAATWARTRVPVSVLRSLRD